MKSIREQALEWAGGGITGDALEPVFIPPEYFDKLVGYHPYPLTDKHSFRTAFELNGDGDDFSMRLIVPENTDWTQDSKRVMESLKLRPVTKTTAEGELLVAVEQMNNARFSAS